MENLSDNKKIIMEYMDRAAGSRGKWIKKNRYYYRDLLKFLKFNIPEGSSVLEIGCGTGFILNALKPARGVGIDISSRMIETAKNNYQVLNLFKWIVKIYPLMKSSIS